MQNPDFCGSGAVDVHCCGFSDLSPLKTTGEPLTVVFLRPAQRQASWPRSGSGAKLIFSISYPLAYPADGSGPPAVGSLGGRPGLRLGTHWSMNKRHHRSQPVATHTVAVR